MKMNTKTSKQLCTELYKNVTLFFILVTPPPIHERNLVAVQVWFCTTVKLMQSDFFAQLELDEIR